MPDEKKPADLPGVEVDDPTIPDDEAEPTADDVTALLEGEEEADDEKEPAGKKADEPPKEPDKPKAEEKPAEKPPEKPQGKTFTEADLERILKDRLARDRAVRDREIQAATGKTLDQLKAEAKANAIEELQAETGWDEARARAHVEERERLRQLEAEHAEVAREREVLKRMMVYQQQKVKSQHASNPLAQQYADEIDQFSEFGASVDYDVAVAFVLGQKVLAGEVLKTTAQATEQKVIRDMERKAKAAPEAATSSAPTSTSLTPIQRAVARNLGISEQAYAKRLAEQQKRTPRAQ